MEIVVTISIILSDRTQERERTNSDLAQGNASGVFSTAVRLCEKLDLWQSDEVRVSGKIVSMIDHALSIFRSCWTLSVT